MQIEHLRYFIALESYKSINRTSQQINTATQNLSRILKNMETEFGMELFYRTKHGVVFTPAGKEFLKFAKETVYRYDFIRAKMSYFQSTNSHESVINIYSQNTINEAILNEVLIEFSKNYPQIIVNNIVVDYQTGYKKLNEDELALGILLYDEDEQDIVEPLDMAGWELVPFLAMHSVAIVNESHALAHKEFFAVQDFIGQTIIVLARESLNNTEVPSLLERFHLEDSVSFITLGNLDACYRLAKEKNYICLGTMESFKKQSPKRRENLVAIPNLEHPYVTYGFIKNKSLPLDSAQQLFCCFALNYIQEKMFA